MIRTKFNIMTMQKNLKKSEKMLSELRKVLIQEVSALNKPLKGKLEFMDTETLIANASPVYRKDYEQLFDTCKKQFKIELDDEKKMLKIDFSL